MKIIKKVDEKFEEYILVTSLIVMLSIVFLQVISRYVFNISLGGSEEFSRYMLVWIIWISASYAVKKKSHIRVELIKKFLPKNLKKTLELIVMTIWFLFTLFIAITGTDLVQSVQMTGQTSPSNGIPMFIVYLIIPLSGILMGLRVLQQAYYILRGQDMLVKEE